MSAVAIDVKLALRVSQPFEVVSWRLVERLSARTHAVVVIASDHDLELEPLLTTPVTLNLAVAGEAARTFALRLGRARLAGYEGGRLRYELDLYDPLWLLGLTKHTRKLRGASARQIVEQVLSEAGIDCRFELLDELSERKYCAQYRESDLAFVERLLEYEGVFYRLLPDGSYLMADRSPAGPPVAEKPFELIEAAGALERGQLGVHEIARRARLASGAVTLGDHNWKSPNLALRESAATDRDELLEVFEYPAGYRKPEQGSRLAQLRLEAIRAATDELEGRSNVPNFAPGFAFSLGGSVGELFAGEYVLVELEHSFVDRSIDSSDTGDTTYANRFTALPIAVPFRPPMRTPRPIVGGLHTAMVRGPTGEEIHTDRYGRFRVQLHWDREAVGTDDDSRWLRLLQESSSSMQLARTGWEMFVGYVDGDPDRPIGLGRAINGVDVPSYAMPGEMNRMTIKTPSSPATGGYSEITMDDSAERQGIGIRAEKDLDVLVKNDKAEDIGHDEEHSVGTDLSRSVMGDQTISIGGNAALEVGENYQIEIGGNRSESVGTDESVEVEGSNAVSVDGDESETVGSLRMTTAGAIQMPDFKAVATNAAIGFMSSACPQAAQAAGMAQSYYEKAKNAGDTDWGEAAQGAAQGAAENFAGQIIDGESVGDAARNSASGALPSRDQLGGMVPNKSWWPTKDGLAQAGKDTFKQLFNLENLINMFCAGGIDRAVTTSSLKIVGGAYVTAAVLGIDLAVGYGYAEAVGGMKLTVAKTIQESVDGTLTVKVGGRIHRVAIASMTISSGASSSVKVGGHASYEVEQGSLSVSLPKTIHVSASSELKLVGGDAEIELSDAGVSMKGSLKTEADTKVKFIGNPLNVTKA